MVACISYDLRHVYNTLVQRIRCKMQITSTVVCGASISSLYELNKPPLVGEHAFPPTGFDSYSAQVTNAWWQWWNNDNRQTRVACDGDCRGYNLYLCWCNV